MILNELFPKVLTTGLHSLSDKKLLINTINAHSYNVALKDELFLKSLYGSDIILPDGEGVVWAYRLLRKKVRKIAGADLFNHQMKGLNQKQGTCFFLGSSEVTLAKIRERASKEYPNVRISTFSPPYKSTFSALDNEVMIAAVNKINPDVLFVGMTAPKQEKWAYEHFDSLKAKHVCCIGAVFDFYAGTVKRAPKWMIAFGLEWLGRLIKEPKRMWHRYLVSSPVIIIDALRYKFKI